MYSSLQDSVLLEPDGFEVGAITDLAISSGDYVRLISSSAMAKQG